MKHVKDEDDYNDGLDDHNNEGLDVSKDSPKKKRAPYATSRKLITWDAEKDQHLLLALVYECDKRGISIPLQEAVGHINSESTAEAARQHLSKVRAAREKHGQQVPPRVARARKQQSVDVTAGAKKKKAIESEDIQPRDPLARLVYTPSKKSKSTSRAAKRNSSTFDNAETHASIKKPRTKRKSKAAKVEADDDDDETLRVENPGPDPDLADEDADWTPDGTKSSTIKRKRGSKSEASVKDESPSPEKLYEFKFGDDAETRTRRAGINYKEPELSDDDLEGNNTTDASLLYQGLPGQDPYGDDAEDDETDDYTKLDRMYSNKSLTKSEDDSMDEQKGVTQKSTDPFLAAAASFDNAPAFSPRFDNFQPNKEKNKIGLGIDTGMNNVHIGAAEVPSFENPWGDPSTRESPTVRYIKNKESDFKHKIAEFNSMPVAASLDIQDVMHQSVMKLVGVGIPFETACNLYMADPKRYRVGPESSVSSKTLDYSPRTAIGGSDYGSNYTPGSFGRTPGGFVQTPNGFGDTPDMGGLLSYSSMSEDTSRTASFSDAMPIVHATAGAYNDGFTESPTHLDPSGLMMPSQHDLQGSGQLDYNGGILYHSTYDHALGRGHILGAGNVMVKDEAMGDHEEFLDDTIDYDEAD